MLAFSEVVKTMSQRMREKNQKHFLSQAMTQDLQAILRVPQTSTSDPRHDRAPNPDPLELHHRVMRELQSVESFHAVSPKLQP